LLRKQAYFTRHFAARAFGLIVFPFIIYLTIFYIHFSILIYSGPGDSFMSPAFQETLKGNELLLNAQGEISFPPVRKPLACAEHPDYGRNTIPRHGYFQA
jgi:hypothetical protein